MARRAPRTQQPADQGALGRREWSDLPGVALSCISQRLPSFVDHLAFAATCRAWRSVAKAARGRFMPSQPPLLCNGAAHPYSPLHNKSYSNKLVKAPNTRILNLCHGHLIVQDDFSITYRKHDIKLRLVHPLTGAAAEAIPEVRAYHLSWVVLTAPPSSPDCVVVASCHIRNHTIIHCRLGAGDDGGWSFHWCRVDEELGQPAVSGVRVYAWSRKRWGVVILEPLPHGYLKETFVEVPQPSWSPLLKLFPRNLAAFGDGIILVELYFRAMEGNMVRGRAIVYLLDESGGRKLMRMRSLGGRSVLVAEDGGCVVSEQPGNWGGEGDKVYFYSTSLGCIITMDYLEESADYSTKDVPPPLGPGPKSSPSFWALFHTCC